MSFKCSFQLSCLLIIPLVPTVWRETGNELDGGGRQARLKVESAVAGGWSPSVKTGRFRAWAEVWPHAPPSRDASLLQWALLGLLVGVFTLLFPVSFFLSVYICSVIEELAKKKISHP